MDLPYDKYLIYPWLRLGLPNTKPVKFINKKTRVFLIGSCFARNVGKWLIKKGYKVIPQGDAWNSRLYYNSFSLYYEFARAFGQF
ncbi:unnamed protein product, partial [marine sediment metagenome]